MQHEVFEQKDIDDSKAFAAIGYLGILCFVPLLLKKDSPYAQFHGKQGLVLFIAEVVLFFINIIPVLGQLVWLFASIVFLKKLKLLLIALLPLIHLQFLTQSSALISYPVYFA